MTPHSSEARPGSPSATLTAWGCAPSFNNRINRNNRINQERRHCPHLRPRPCPPPKRPAMRTSEMSRGCSTPSTMKTSVPLRPADVRPHTSAPQGDRGPAGFRGVMVGLRAAFPDIHYTVDELVAEGDRVAARWHWTGTHKGPVPRVSAHRQGDLELGRRNLPLRGRQDHRWRHRDRFASDSWKRSARYPRTWAAAPAPRAAAAAR